MAPLPLCSPGRYRISNRGTVKSFFACSLFLYFALVCTWTHMRHKHTPHWCGNLPERDIRFWFQRWVKKRLDNGISESWKVILSKLSFVEDNECRLSLCVTIQQRIRLRAEPQHTIEPQLAKNSNQAKTKRRVQFNSFACSFWHESVAAMSMVDVIHQHTTTRGKNTQACLCVSVCVCGCLSAHFPVCYDELGLWFWKDRSNKIYLNLPYTLFFMLIFYFHYVIWDY